MQTPGLHELEENYRRMSDDEILHLAAEMGSVTDQARDALNAELRKRNLELASPALPSSASAKCNQIGGETPDLGRIEEIYRQMTDGEILHLAGEMDSLTGQAAETLYAEVCRRNLEEAVALQGADPSAEPPGTEDVPLEGTIRPSRRYAGFWPRLGGLLLDSLIWLPLSALWFWGDERYRLFRLYYLVPGTLFGLFYSVYLVRRFGGTPGKLIMGIRIRKLSGEPVGYREAFLRYCPEFLLGLLVSIALLYPLLRMSDSEYHALSFLERSKRIVQLAPSWYRPLEIVQNVWLWGELIVLLTNRKRRALHDFIAGTVVVRTSPNTSLQPTAAAPVS